LKLVRGDKAGVGLHVKVEVVYLALLEADKDIAADDAIDPCKGQVILVEDKIKAFPVTPDDHLLNGTPIEASGHVTAFDLVEIAQGIFGDHKGIAHEEDLTDRIVFDQHADRIRRHLVPRIPEHRIAIKMDGGVGRDVHQ